MECRLYFLRQLKRSEVTPEELMLFYITCIRSTLNMHVPCSIALCQATSARTWRDCKNVHCELFNPGMPYNQALEFSGLPTLFKMRDEISSKLFNEVVGDPGHTLHKLLPPKNPANYFLRKNRDFALPLCKTDRCKKSFIFSHVFSA